MFSNFLKNFKKTTCENKVQWVVSLLQKYVWHEKTTTNNLIIFYIPKMLNNGLILVLDLLSLTFLLWTPWTMLLDALLRLLAGPESPVTVTMTSLVVSSLMEFRASMDRCLTSLLAASIVWRSSGVTPVRWEDCWWLIDSAGDNRRVERGGQGLPCPRSGVTEPEPESERREVRCDTGARRGQPRHGGETWRPSRNSWLNGIISNLLGAGTEDGTWMKKAGQWC